MPLKDIECSIHQRIAEASAMLNSLARAMCNGHSAKANLRAEKKAQELVRKSEKLFRLIQTRSELAKKLVTPQPWEKT